jgi:hypothetical protein
MSDCNSCDSDLMAMMLRAIIGDLDSSDYEYTTQKLKILLATASRIVISETYTGQTSYSVELLDIRVGEFTINPEPSDIICSMIVTKAACLILNAELRAAANLDGLKAACGPASISKTEGGRSWQILMEEGPCAAYKDLKYKTETSGLTSGSYFKAILTPFINDRFRDSKWCPNDMF